ncbi:MAG: DUF362 domain-containing protein [Alphaproteobacteria bacterium]|nr:DUF362 domain-containing protein [Alphaproteobacteria bacterium]
MKIWAYVAGGIVIVSAALFLFFKPRGETMPKVYFTSDISAAGLVRAYRAAGWTPRGRVAVKMTTGEPPRSNYLRPDLVRDLIQSVDGTIVECNTAYDGARADSANHWRVVKEHGFFDVAPVDIQDEDGDMALPVHGGKVLTENYVGSHFDDYDSYIILSHFKGHAMAGYGGAIKNISIGLGSRMGKSWIHSGGTSKTNPWGGEQTAFLESMADAGKSVVDHLGRDNIIYINVLNRISIDCDCNGNPAEPDIHDIGILVSTDPVAIDQAAIDMVSRADGNAALMQRIAERNGLHTLESAAEIGLGVRTYELVNLDEK